MNTIAYVTHPTALDTDGICKAQQTLAADHLAMDGDLVGDDGVVLLAEQAHVTIASTGNLAGITFTVTGRDKRGRSVSEDLAGPNNGTVSTVANFSSISDVYADAAISTDVTVGNSDALETAWCALDRYRPQKGITIQLSTNADLTYELQFGATPVGEGSEADVVALADTTLTNRTAAASMVALIPWPLARLKITSFVAGTATLHISEVMA